MRIFFYAFRQKNHIGIFHWCHKCLTPSESDNTTLYLLTLLDKKKKIDIHPPTTHTSRNRNPLSSQPVPPSVCRPTCPALARGFLQRPALTTKRICQFILLLLTAKPGRKNEKFFSKGKKIRDGAAIGPFTLRYTRSERLKRTLGVIRKGF